MYQETDIVQDLYNEIEHFIDIPFENKTESPYKPVQPQQLDFHYKHQLENEEKEEQQRHNEIEEYDEQKHDQQVDSHHNSDYRFERPILIESDSDDIEEEVTTPCHDPHYSVSTCYQCDKPIPFQPSNTLSVAGTNQLCSDCSNSSSNTSKKKGRRSRSSSFTFSQFANKLKQSFGHSSSSNSHLLNPAGIKSVDRRKSMPSMNSLFQNEQLQPPLSTSPQPSRPSSRASSFIEDVKQFLSPLSRKSSRNSMHQDYSQQEPEMKRKTSHNSLLDAFSLCKPSPKPHRQNSYERRVIQQQQQHDDNSWTQEDAEVSGVHHSSSGYFQQQHEEQNYPQHIPLRRKQIRQIESRQDRMDIYNNAYMEVMNLETELVPWIVKQTQKGPPDAWFGYTPPAREPKKIMGLFKRKTKTTTDLRTQQQQLGDELLHRSTPLLQHRFSNSNLSRSPSNQSFIAPDQHQQELVSSPSALIQQNCEEQEGYFDENALDHRFTSPNSYSSFDPRSSSTNLSPNSNLETISRTPSTIQQQPVSILKKSNSNVSMNKNYHQQQSPAQPYYDVYNDEEVDPYDGDRYDEGEGEYDDQYDQQHYPPPPPQPQTSRQKQRSRPSSSAGRMDDYYGHNKQQQTMMPLPVKEKRKQHRHSSTSPGYHHQQQQMYMVEPSAMTRRRRSISGSYRSDYDRDDYYNNENDYYHQAPPSQQQQRPSSRHRRQQSQYYEEEEVDVPPTTASYNDSIALNKKESHIRHYKEEEYYAQQSQQEEEAYYYENEGEDEYYQQPPPDIGKRGKAGGRKASTSKKEQQQQKNYYGLGVKVTPYMMEEWEMALDDLCDLYPRLDRHYINDFLRSAQGDFVTAKDMIMDMIMEIR